MNEKFNKADAEVKEKQENLNIELQKLENLKKTMNE